jgi:hypothetical protein
MVRCTFPSQPTFHAEMELFGGQGLTFAMNAALIMLGSALSVAILQSIKGL